MIQTYSRPGWLGLVAVVFAVAACGGGASVPQDVRPEDAPGDLDASIDAGLDASDGGADIDAGTDASLFVCDPVHQSGCLADEKCDIAANGTFACVPDGSLGDSRLCDPAQPNACAAGFTCRQTSFDDYRCARLCTPGESQCRTEEPCIALHTTSDGKPYRTCASRHECNPLLDDCSVPGKHCSYFVIGVCVTPGP